MRFWAHSAQPSGTALCCQTAMACPPLDWATTQSNLGNALLTLGERESGTETHRQSLLVGVHGQPPGHVD